MGYLIQSNKQSSTVKSYISVKAVLKMNNISINPDQYLLSSLTHACRLKNDCFKARLPIRWGMLSILLDTAHKHFLDINQPFLDSLYRTVLSTMYFGLLRISEVAEGAHQILARDVHIGDNKRKFLLILRSSKTLFKNMHPQSIKISSKKLEKQKRVTCQVNNEFHGLPCPYQPLKQYAVLCGGYLCDNEPFFVFADKSPLKLSQLRSCLWLLLIKSGFNRKFYGSTV